MKGFFLGLIGAVTATGLLCTGIFIEHAAQQQDVFCPEGVTVGEETSSMMVGDRVVKVVKTCGQIPEGPKAVPVTIHRF